MVIIGVLLLVAKMAEFGPTADWSWWIVLAPFGLAVVWWQFSDSTGLTQRRAMDKMDERKKQRRQRALEALGMNRPRHKPAAPVAEPPRSLRTADPTQAGTPDPDAEPPRREPRL
jgi:small Trp-rich protein